MVRRRDVLVERSAIPFRCVALLIGAYAALPSAPLVAQPCVNNLSGAVSNVCVVDETDISARAFLLEDQTTVPSGVWASGVTLPTESARPLFAMYDPAAGGLSYSEAAVVRDGAAIAYFVEYIPDEEELCERDDADAPSVVISQVYGGGGNLGATFANDFVELHNRTDSAVNLNNWTLQYASAQGTHWTRAYPNVIEIVGYGSAANCYQGDGPAPTPSAMTEGVLRDNAACGIACDTEDDFIVATASPRNSGSNPAFCGGP